MLRVHQLLKQHSRGVQVNPWDLWTGFKMFIDALKKKSQTGKRLRKRAHYLSIDMA